MPKHKKKVIVNKELAKSQRLPVRMPTAKPTEFHTDKSKYDRKKGKSIPAVDESS
jgi:hypothetical protein